MIPEETNPVVGDYQLTELLIDAPQQRVWLAKQISIDRLVMLVVLDPGHAGDAPSFLADARAKAAVKHPALATVFEAVSDAESCFFAQEWLPTQSLAKLKDAGGALSPARMAKMLRCVAESQIHLESTGMASAAIELEHIRIDPADVIRLDNLVVAGERDPQRSATDITQLGHDLVELLAQSRPGTTRLLTLLSWMRGEGIESALTWSQVVEVCQQIEQQLTQPAHVVTPTLPIAKNPSFLRRYMTVAIAVPACVGLIALAWYLRPIGQRGSADEPHTTGVVDNKPAKLIRFNAGRYAMPDGSTPQLAGFQFSSREVSVGEYREFLDSLELIAPSGNEKVFDHRSQPAEKSSHLPDRWQEQCAGPLQHPVTGVDWWDAVAFATWKKAALPTHHQWFAAITHLPPDPSITQSVREWTRDPATDPSNPYREKQWPLLRRTTDLTGPPAEIEWTTDRHLRRSDLGFRICFEAD
ncbi:MAG: SUMF1/EgtB/PvdO family nonheme iron enzyme [Luteolibacter sp.]